jgi:hypothetical protein
MNIICCRTNSNPSVEKVVVFDGQVEKVNILDGILDFGCI